MTVEENINAILVEACKYSRERSCSIEEQSQMEEAFIAGAKLQQLIEIGNYKITQE